MTIKLSWCQDVLAETNLRQLGVVFEVGKVPFSKLDLLESQVNGARIDEALIRDVILDYKQAMINGSVFPRPVLHTGKAGWVILSGNQRCAAIGELIKEGKVPETVQIEAYKLDGCDQLIKEIIARSFNCYHGEGQKHAQRMKHAIRAVRGLGMKPAEAARLFTVDATHITRNIRAEKERQELQRAGIDATRMSISALDQISKLPFDQNAKHQVAILAAKHDVPGDRVKQIVDTLKTAKTQHARTAKVKAFEKELADQAGATAKPKSSNGRSKVPSRPRRDKVLGLCETLVQFLEHGNEGESFTTLDQLQFTGDADTARLKTLVGRLSMRWNVLRVS